MDECYYSVVRKYSDFKKMFKLFVNGYKNKQCLDSGPDDFFHVYDYEQHDDIHYTEYNSLNRDVYIFYIDPMGHIGVTPITSSGLDGIDEYVSGVDRFVEIPLGHNCNSLGEM